MGSPSTTWDMRGCLLLLGLGVLTLMTAAGTHGEEDVFGQTEDGTVLMDIESGVQENLVDREAREVKPIKKGTVANKGKKTTATKKAAKTPGIKKQTKLGSKTVVRAVSGKNPTKTAAKKGQPA